MFGIGGLLQGWRELSGVSHSRLLSFGPERPPQALLQERLRSRASLSVTLFQHTFVTKYSRFDFARVLLGRRGRIYLGRWRDLRPDRLTEMDEMEGAEQLGVWQYRDDNDDAQMAEAVPLQHLQQPVLQPPSAEELAGIAKFTPAMVQDVLTSMPPKFYLGADFAQLCETMAAEYGGLWAYPMSIVVGVVAGLFGPGVRASPGPRRPGHKSPMLVWVALIVPPGGGELLLLPPSVAGPPPAADRSPLFPRRQVPHRRWRQPLPQDGQRRAETGAGWDGRPRREAHQAAEHQRESEHDRQHPTSSLLRGSRGLHTKIIFRSV